MRLAILLTTGPESPDRQTVRSLAEAALARGHRVDLFLMVDGVCSAPFLADLSGKGASVVWCSHNARQRELASVQGVQEGSQYEWASMVAEADRVIAFN